MFSLYLEKSKIRESKELATDSQTHTQEKAKLRLEPRSVWLQPSSAGG